jgi:hypothetical protein
MLTTTLKRIRAHVPCSHGWEKLLHGLGKTRADDEPLPYSTILRINGLHDALWCCRVESEHSKEWQLFAVWCARKFEHLLTDPRSIEALDVAERYALGTATEQELETAEIAARKAARYITVHAPGTIACGAAWAASRIPVGRLAGEVARESTKEAALIVSWNIGLTDMANTPGTDIAEAFDRARFKNGRDEVLKAAWAEAHDAQSVEFLRVVD